MSWPYYLTPLIPGAIVMKLLGAPDTAVFFASALGLIPPAALMGDATEELAARSGPGVGGILNVTFGNAPELIVALFALGEGLHEVVKASLVGSVVGNIMLVLGAAMLVAGRIRGDQSFDAGAIRGQARMLLIAGAAPIALSAYVLLSGGELPDVHAVRVDFSPSVEHISAVIAAVLIVAYFFALRSSLREYARLAQIDEEHEGWSVRQAMLALTFAGVLIGVMSEVLVGSIQAASHSIGLSQFFIGFVVVAIVGNAAEHWVAVLVAVKGKMDLAVSIAIGSSAQVALFIMPLLGLASFFIGPAPMPLVFNALALAALIVSVLMARWFTHDGRARWWEGAQLLAVYAAFVVVAALA